MGRPHLTWDYDSADFWQYLGLPTFKKSPQSSKTYCNWEAVSWPSIPEKSVAVHCRLLPGLVHGGSRRHCLRGFSFLNMHLHFTLYLYYWASLIAQLVKNPPAWEKEMATHSSILAWRIPGQRSLVDYSPWDRKESDTTEWLTQEGSEVLQPLQEMKKSWLTLLRLPILEKLELVDGNDKQGQDRDHSSRYP